MYNVKKYITKWNIREEEIYELILTDSLELYIIETRKARDLGLNYENKTLNSWLQFINNPGVILKMENKEIKKAREVLEEISKDKKERYLAELRQKYIMDQKAIEGAGYDKGFEAGIEQRHLTTASSNGIEQRYRTTASNVENHKELIKKKLKLRKK